MNEDHFYEIIRPIIEHPEYQKRKNYEHHDKISVYEHSIAVARMAYDMAQAFHLDAEDTAIAGVLHDFYETPLNLQEKRPFFEKHAFTHGKNAYQNAKKYFPTFLNDKIKDSIEAHMFPITLNPPKYLEGWIITIADKLVSLEVFLHPATLPRLLGIKKDIPTDQIKASILLKIALLKNRLHL